MKFINDVEKIESEYIYILKAIAILSVVSAHLSPVSESTYTINKIFGEILNIFGTLGVGVFFLLSGYLYAYNQQNLIMFMKKKITTIIIPWIFCSTLTFFYITTRKGGISLNNWLRFVIGDGSIFYFITVLIFLYILFYKAKNNMVILKILCLISSISITITGLDMLNGINPYLNVLNWMGYFSVGILINKKLKLKIITKFSKENIIYLSIIYIFIILISFYIGDPINYWSHNAVIRQALGTLIILGLGDFKFLHKDYIIELGKKSFTMYLIHIPFAGMIVKIFNILDLWYLTLFRPFINVLICILLLRVYQIFINKMKLNYVGNLIIGIREKGRCQT